MAAAEALRIESIADGSSFFVHKADAHVGCFRRCVKGSSIHSISQVQE